MWHGGADRSTLGIVGLTAQLSSVDPAPIKSPRSRTRLDPGTNFPAVDLLRTSPLRLADELDPARFSLHEFFRKRAIGRRAHAIRFVFDDWFTEAGSFS